MALTVPRDHGGATQQALAAAENEVFSALDHDQRETLYRLLQQATAGHIVDCAAAVRQSCTEHG